MDCHDPLHFLTSNIKQERDLKALVEGDACGAKMKKIARKYSTVNSVLLGILARIYSREKNFANFVN